MERRRVALSRPRGGRRAGRWVRRSAARPVRKPCSAPCPDRTGRRLGQQVRGHQRGGPRSRKTDERSATGIGGEDLRARQEDNGSWSKTRARARRFRIRRKVVGDRRPAQPANLFEQREQRGPSILPRKRGHLEVLRRSVPHKDRTGGRGWPPVGASCGCVRVVPCQAGRPSVGPDCGDQDAQQRGLARPVTPRHHEHRTPKDASSRPPAPSGGRSAGGAVASTAWVLPCIGHFYLLGATRQIWMFGSCGPMGRRGPGKKCDQGTGVGVLESPGRKRSSSTGGT